MIFKQIKKNKKMNKINYEKFIENELKLNINNNEEINKKDLNVND